MVKVRRCIWLERNTILLLESKGIDLSTVVSKTLHGFLDLPDDPFEKLLKEKVSETVIRLRINYEGEIRDRIREHAAQQQVQDLDRAAADKRARELLSLGNQLQKISCWPLVRQALQDLDPEAHCWTVALHEINETNGDRWEFETLWNTAIEWYRKYGCTMAVTK